MDGARFANAVAGLGCTPAELTWKAGVDVLSFGGTKNGCFGVEAVVLFEPERSWELELRRKRAGHLVSKHRFLSAQMEAYLADGLWHTLAARANFLGVQINEDFAQETLRDLLTVHSQAISISNIQKTVADYYKIRVTDMHSKKRSRAIARPRQVAMALSKELTQLSLPEIGSNFGGRDHTTVLHACRQIAKLRESQPELNKDVNFLLQVLRN